jgi:hypothetical protein
MAETLIEARPQRDCLFPGLAEEFEVASPEFVRKKVGERWMTL